MKHLLFLSLVLFLVTCGDAPTPEKVLSKTEQTAQSLCNCTAQLIALNQKFQQNADSLAFQQISDEATKAMACAQKPGLKAQERPEVEAELAKSCPALAAQKELLELMYSQ